MAKLHLCLRAQDKIQSKWQKQMTNSNESKLERTALLKAIFRVDLEQ